MTQSTAGYTVPLAQVVEAGFPVFSRASKITVGPVEINNMGEQSGLDVEFTIKRTLKAKSPNHGDLKIWNLSAASLAALGMPAQKTTVTSAPPSGSGASATPVSVIPVQIDAGYVGHTSTIFAGFMRSAQSVTDGPDVVTELNTGDGDVALELQRISKGFQAGSTPSQVVGALLDAMGIGQGNLAAVASVFAEWSAFLGGTVIKGNPACLLADICASVGVEFSIQNGTAQFLPIGKPLAGPAYLLSSGTGLVGTPTVDTTGLCSFTSFILPGLLPGAPVQIQSVFVSGLFRIVSVEFTGNTRGNEWYAKCEAQSYGGAP